MNQREKDLAMIKTGLALLKNDKLERMGKVPTDDDYLELVRDRKRLTEIMNDLENNYSASRRRKHIKKSVMFTAVRDYGNLQSSFTRRAVKKAHTVYGSTDNLILEKECLRLSKNMKLQQEYITRLSLAVGEEEIEEAINSKPKF